MQLDNSQPWMLNKAIKARICLAKASLANPVMLEYQKEFRAMALVPIDNVVSRSAEFNLPLKHF